MRTPRDLAHASLAATKAGDREAWLALFPEDGVVEDPVGVSPLDPTGKGRRGKAAIAKFWDDVISHNKDFNAEITEGVLRGDEFACVVAFKITSAGGKDMIMKAINIYKATDDGRLASLRSFWDPAAFVG
jgi:ketosteroid isomerase-like protein